MLSRTRISSALRTSLRSRSFWSKTAPDPSLHATVAPHHLYLFLHSRVPPMEAPSRPVSSLRVTLQRSLSQFGGIVNFSWAPDQLETETHGNRERYKATAYSRTGGRLDLDEVSSDNMQDVLHVLGRHARGEAKAGANTDDRYAVDMYVCTHKDRDCRCGEHGYAVVQALREEVARRKTNPADAAHKIRLIGETTHVGGHKYAANVLIYPHGDWLGNVRPEHVPSIVDAVLQLPVRPSSEHEPPLLPALWRGRMGLSSDQQSSLYEKYSS